MASFTFLLLFCWFDLLANVLKVLAPVLLILVFVLLLSPHLFIKAFLNAGLAAFFLIYLLISIQFIYIAPRHNT